MAAMLSLHAHLHICTEGQSAWDLYLLYVGTDDVAA